MTTSPTSGPGKRVPVVLCILDGWGYRTAPDHNAIAKAATPVYDRLWKRAPHSLIRTSGTDVGLPEGQMGNSEVGHMCLGSGRIPIQLLPRITQAVVTGALEKNRTLRAFVKRLKETSGTCHLMGLLSPGGVHSDQSHIVALARIVARAGVPVAVHGFLDGRDTPPQSGRQYVSDFLDEIAADPLIRLATLAGRYYAMDRDHRWERIEQAYECLAAGAAPAWDDPIAAIEASYSKGITDEFVRPVTLQGYRGMSDGDGLIMANFRADRAREILSALLDPDFSGFARSRSIRFSSTCGMAEYSQELTPHLPPLFPSESTQDTLGETVANAGLRQLRIAETEKYAHVTFFFNGGQETAFKGEDRVLIPSPRVATYDLQPEMSAPAVTSKLIEAIRHREYDLIIANYANPDMVGHTGIMAAAVKAVETIDQILGELERAVEETGAVLLITADHGNIELMCTPGSAEPHTAHTTFEVPLIAVNLAAVYEKLEIGQVKTLRDGRLSDIAPTILELLGLPQPEAMTGHSLLVKDKGTGRGATTQRHVDHSPAQA